MKLRSCKKLKFTIDIVSWLTFHASRLCNLCIKLSSCLLGVVKAKKSGFQVYKNVHVPLTFDKARAGETQNSAEFLCDTKRLKFVFQHLMQAQQTLGYLFGGTNGEREKKVSCTCCKRAGAWLSLLGIYGHRKMTRKGQKKMSRTYCKHSRHICVCGRFWNEFGVWQSYDAVFQQISDRFTKTDGGAWEARDRQEE